MMIQNAAFIEVTPAAAAMQPGMGTPPASAAAGTGRFEQLLQDSQPKGAAAGDAPKGDSGTTAKTPPATIATAAVPGESAAETARQQKVEQPALQGDLKKGAGTGGEAVWSYSARNGLAAEAAQTATTADAAQQGPAVAGAKLQLVMAWKAVPGASEIGSLTAEAQQGQPVGQAAPQEGAAAKAVTAEGRVVMPEKQSLPSDAGHKTDAAAAPHSAPLADSAQLAAAGTAMVAAVETKPAMAAGETKPAAVAGVEHKPAMVAAVETRPAMVAAVETRPAMVAAVETRPAMVAGETKPAMAGVETKPAAVAAVETKPAMVAAGETRPATVPNDGKVVVPPGLAVAARAVQANMEQRGGAAPAAAGEQALSRLSTLQEAALQPAMKEAVTSNGTGAQQEGDLLAPDRQKVVTAGGITAAASKLGQEAELAKVAPQDNGRQTATMTGATERAQVEVPHAAKADQVLSGWKAAQPEAASVAKPATVDVKPATSATVETKLATAAAVDAKPAASADVAVTAAPQGASKSREESFIAMPVRGQSFQAAAAAKENGTAQASAGTGEAVEAVTPGVGTNPATVKEPVLAGLQDQGKTMDTAAGATEGAQVEVEVPNGAAKPAVQAAAGCVEQQTAPVELARQEVAQATNSSQDRRDLRQGEGPQGAQAKETVPAEQAGVAPTASDEVSGTKTASAATAGFTPEHGTGRDASGDAGRKGHPEQKPQEQNAQLQGAGLGQGTTAADEIAHPETKEAAPRSALHENILSQVKSGVLTHDGKGNGEMSIRLNPGELGELKIQVRMEDNRLKVEVQADNRMVKDLLLGNLDTLKEALSGKNFTMEGFDVSTGGGGFNAPLHEEKGNPRQQSMPRFARGAGYGGQEEARVNYLTGEVNNLLDVRF